MRPYTPPTTMRLFALRSGYDDLDKAPDHREIDFTRGLALGSLRRVITVERVGEVREVTYSTVTGEEVVQERIAYTRDVSGQAIRRWTQRSYWNVLGNKGVVEDKWSQKRYDLTPWDSYREAQRRWALNTQALFAGVIEDLILTEAGPPSFFEAQNLFLNPWVSKRLAAWQTYRELGDLGTLAADVIADPEGWLGNTRPDGLTIRDRIIARLVRITSVADEVWSAAVRAGPP